MREVQSQDENIRARGRAEVQGTQHLRDDGRGIRSGDIRGHKMSRPIKLNCDTRSYNLTMRQKQWDTLSRKADELTRLTRKQVSVADIIRLCIDMHGSDVCDEIERRYRAQTY